MRWEKTPLGDFPNPAPMAEPHAAPTCQHISEQGLYKTAAAEVFFLYQSKHQVLLDANGMHMIGVISFY